MQMPGPRDIVIYRPHPRTFSIVQKPWGWTHISVQKPQGARGMVTGQIDTCITGLTALPRHRNKAIIRLTVILHVNQFVLTPGLMIKSNEDTRNFPWICSALKPSREHIWSSQAWRLVGSLSKLMRWRSTGKSPFKFRVMDVKGRMALNRLEFPSTSCL